MVDIDGAGPGRVGVHQTLPGGGGGDTDLQAQDLIPVAQVREGHLFPAGEVQRHAAARQIALRAVAAQQGEDVAGAVAIDPHVQGIVRGAVDDGALDRPPLGGIGPGAEAAVGLGEGVVHPGGTPAQPDSVGAVVQAEVQSAAVSAEDGGAALKGLYLHDAAGGDRAGAGDGDGDGDSGPAGGDRDGAGARRGGSKEAVLIHRADVAGDLPGEGFRIRLQGDVVVGGGGGQLGGGAGGGIQRGERGAAAVPDHHVRGILDGVDGGRAFSAAAGGGDGDLTAPFRGGEDIAVQLPVGGLQVVVIVLVHGDVVGVYGGGGDLYLAARQNVGVVRLDVEVAQFAGGLIGGHQEQVVGHRPLTAVGGAVDGSGGGVVGLRHGDGGGAAAVQADGGHAAQLDHPLGHLAQAGADGVAGPAAVDGIEHHGAVSCHTYRRAGVHPGGQTGDHGAVLHQGV